MRSLPPLPHPAIQVLFGLAFATLTLPGLAAAAPSPCQAPPPTSQLLLSALGGEKAAIKNLPGAQVGLRRSLIAWQRAAPQRGIALGYGHEYSVVEWQSPAVPLEERRGNGHFHHLSLPVDLSALLPQAWSLRVQPALAVSSNQLRHFDRLQSRDWQFSAALLRSWAGSQGSRWEAGLCIDSRFGEPRLYPSLSWTLETAAWTLRLGLPDSAIRRRLGATVDASLELFPDGNRWRVHDDAAPPSWHAHEGWRAEALLGWEPLRRWRLEAALGAWLDQRHRFVLRSGRHLEGEDGTSGYLRVALIWRPGD